MAQAIIDCAIGVGNGVWSVHWLQEEMLEFERVEFLRHRVVLRKNELELAAACLYQGSTGFRTDADPIE